MPSLPEAYSREHDDIMHASLAWALSTKTDGSGLSDARAFACPHAGCRAQATLVNFGRDRNELRVTPHFRMNEPHDMFCPYADEDLVSERPIELEGSASNNKADTEGLPDYANLNEPGTAQQASQRSSKTAAASTPRERRYDLSFTSLGGIVATYATLRRHKEQHEKILKLSGDARPYNEWFVPLYKGLGRIKQLQSNTRIFWAEAWINRTKKDDGYLLSFITGPKDDTIYTARMFISDDEFQSTTRGERQLKRLALLMSEKRPATVFFYGQLPFPEGKPKDIFTQLHNPLAIEIQRKSIWTSLKAPEL